MSWKRTPPPNHTPPNPPYLPFSQEEAKRRKAGFDKEIGFNGVGACDRCGRPSPAQQLVLDDGIYLGRFCCLQDPDRHLPDTQAYPDEDPIESCSLTSEPPPMELVDRRIQQMIDDSIDQGLQELKRALSDKLVQAVDFALPKVLDRKLKKYADTQLEAQIERVVQKTILDLRAYDRGGLGIGGLADNQLKTCPGCYLHTRRLFELEKAVVDMQRLVERHHVVLRAVQMVNQTAASSLRTVAYQEPLSPHALLTLPLEIGGAGRVGSAEFGRPALLKPV